MRDDRTVVVSAHPQQEEPAPSLIDEFNMLNLRSHPDTLHRAIIARSLPAPVSHVTFPDDDRIVLPWRAVEARRPIIEAVALRTIARRNWPSGRAGWFLR